MTNQDTIEFEIEVSAQDATEEDLDRMARNLLAELRGSDVESVRLVSSGIAPEGSKGDGVQIGMLTVDVLSAAAPTIVALIQAWVTREQGRTVKFKAKGIEFEGSPQEFQKLLASLAKGKKKK